MLYVVPDMTNKLVGIREKIARDSNAPNCSLVGLELHQVGIAM